MLPSPAQPPLYFIQPNSKVAKDAHVFASRSHVYGNYRKWLKAKKLQELKSSFKFLSASLSRTILLDTTLFVAGTSLSNFSKSQTGKDARQGSITLVNGRTAVAGQRLLRPTKNEEGVQAQSTDNEDTQAISRQRAIVRKDFSAILGRIEAASSDRVAYRSVVPVSRASSIAALQKGPPHRFPIPRSDHITDMFEFFAKVMAMKWGNEVVIEGHTNPALTITLNVALQCDYLFHIVMALARVVSRIFHQKAPFQDLFAMHHRGQALTLLRQNACNWEDDALPIAIFYYTVLEKVLGDNTNVAVHYAGLEEIMARRRMKQRTSKNSSTIYIESLYKFSRSLASTWDESQSEDLASPETDNSSRSQTDPLQVRLEDPIPFDMMLGLVDVPGFRDLHLSRRISVKTLRVVLSINSAIQEDSDKHPERCIATMRDAIPPESVIAETITEQYLYAGLRIFVWQIEAQLLLQPIPPNQVDWTMERFSFFGIGDDGFPPKSMPQACLVWVFCCAQGLLHRSFNERNQTSRVTTRPHMVLTAVLQVFKAAREWDEVEAILTSMFFPDCLRGIWHEAWEICMNSMGSREG